MIVAPGACRRLKPPYPYGAISISFGETLFNIRTDNFMLGLTFLAPLAILFLNILLVFKVRRILFERKWVSKRKTDNIISSLIFRMNSSKKQRKSHISLTLTTLAIMIQHLASGAKTVIGIVRPELVPYALIIRHRLIDLGMISVPWIFYISHPMFHEKTARVSSFT
ncbi:hypothetical protein CRE_25387 [Caenorhabditis remanei]|uniref:G-protein coupled receptors family 1 profile domain-containing protein n=1 Tax=Caenorhabditis remanei TaxID=31234 RepID=E3LSV9_CAERE|nr:hypothetical protein CRE_25387 [Caenorhabditis remanei]